ncbi:MAG: hypothetical protein HYY61_04445, partial [Deltaproteobacteria bacterium]|nr:hypothetical protein [Deltaproteobacteria bacterium]
MHKKSRFYLMLLFTFVVLACVTVNVYFPEAAVQEAADKFVERVKKGESKEDKKGKEGSSFWIPSLIGTAEAQERQIRIDFPEIRAAEAKLRESYQKLLPYFNSGTVTEG